MYLKALSSLSLQAELTFCAGDVITVFGEIDEDGFYYVSTKPLHVCSSPGPVFFLPI